MKTKRILILLLIALLIFQLSAFASILGSESITTSSLNIGEGATLFTNSFYSDQYGVGLQTENYVEYTPNNSLTPVVINDNYLYGKKNVSGMASSLMSNGIYPVMLMNSDFFSFQTGVPMSHQVCNGILTTKDSSSMDAIGINPDGSAFISWLSIKTTVTVGENTISIDNFNKYRQPYVIYMLDDKFGNTTKATNPGLNVIIGSLDGDLEIGSTVKGVVESVVKSDGEIEIPKGKIVLTADDRVPAEVYAQLGLFKKGDSTTINTNAEGDSRWQYAKDILGCFGGRLIKDGTVLNVDESAAPRSAFGIKQDGSLIFYTIDGRQSGHSYGIRLNTLAKRMKELGCVDAVNLDGGGSTSIGGVYPGNDNFSLINKPSDGNERQVATFIGLMNTSKSTGTANKLFLYPYGKNYLSGATQKFTVLATDSAYYKSPSPENIVFTAPDGTQSSDSNVKITGNGEVIVSASSGAISGNVTVNSFETPDKIKINNQDTGNTVDSLSVSVTDSVNLSASASLGHKNLIADDSCFEWKCISTSGNIGTVDTNGYFTAGDENATGVIQVSAGGFSTQINVTVSATNNSYTDISFEQPVQGQLKIGFLNADGVGIKSENIQLKVDGNDTKVNLENNCINLVFADNLSHKINVSVKNNADLETVAFYSVQGNEHSNIFADIDSHWAKSFITYMNNNKVVNGTVVNDKTYFYPSNNITRAEFAVMVANMLKTDVKSYADKKLTVDDAADIPSWAANHIKALCELNIMNGKQDGSKVYFKPSDKLTRAEAVTVISRIIQNKIRTTETSFTDAYQIPDWSKEGFNKLSALKIISGYEDGSVKPLNNITRAETIKLLYEIY